MWRFNFVYKTFIACCIRMKRFYGLKSLQSRWRKLNTVMLMIQRNCTMSYEIIVYVRNYLEIINTNEISFLVAFVSFCARYPIQNQHKELKWFTIRQYRFGI